jgi:hypothetical protein
MCIRSSVGIVLGYRLDDRESRVRFPAGAGNFSLLHRVQNGSGAHPASYPMGTRGSFLGDKGAGAWSWPLTPSSAEVKERMELIHPFPQYAFKAWCSAKAQGQLYLSTLAAGNSKLFPMNWGSLHLVILLASLNDRSSGFNARIVMFPNACLCLWKLFSFLWRN